MPKEILISQGEKLTEVTLSDETASELTLLIHLGIADHLRVVDRITGRVTYPKSEMIEELVKFTQTQFKIRIMTSPVKNEERWGRK